MAKRWWGHLEATPPVTSRKRHKAMSASKPVKCSARREVYQKCTSKTAAGTNERQGEGETQVLLDKEIDGSSMKLQDLRNLHRRNVHDVNAAYPWMPVQLRQLLPLALLHIRSSYVSSQATSILLSVPLTWKIPDPSILST